MTDLMQLPTLIFDLNAKRARRDELAMDIEFFDEALTQQQLLELFHLSAEVDSMESALKAKVRALTEKYCG